MDEIETINYRGYEIKVYPDTDPCDSPRDWDNLGTMVLWHRRYQVGDEHSFNDPDEFQEFLKENPAIVLPVYGYDHGGLTISTTVERGWHHYSWDGGQLGYIYVTLEKVRKEYNKKHVSKQLRERIMGYLEQEVVTYNDYLTGNIYGYKIINPDGEELDSLWGFYGYNHKESGLLEQAQSYIDNDIEEVQAHNEMLQMRFDLCF